MIKKFLTWLGFGKKEEKPAKDEHRKMYLDPYTGIVAVQEEKPAPAKPVVKEAAPKPPRKRKPRKPKQPVVQAPAPTPPIVKKKRAPRKKKPVQ